MPQAGSSRRVICPRLNFGVLSFVGQRLRCGDERLGVWSVAIERQGGRFFGHGSDVTAMSERLLWPRGPRDPSRALPARFEAGSPVL